MRAALIALLLIATPAVAAEPTVLTLGESAERAVPQDKLFVSLRAEATAPNAAAVQAEINKRMDAAIARAKAVQGVEVETGGYWTSEERPQGQPRRWRGAATLEISGTDFASVTALAGGLQEAGLAMSGMRFDLRRETARAAEDVLTREALARVQARAASAADALNMKIAGYRAIRVGAVNEQPPMRSVMMRAAPAMAMADAAPAPSAEPGRATVRVSVEADVLLEAK